MEIEQLKSLLSESRNQVNSLKMENKELSMKIDLKNRSNDDEYQRYRE